jgi:hypothetical protein
MKNAEFDEGVDNALKRVAAMDKVDGFKDREVLTILGAIEAGIRSGDKTCLFDAYAMLMDWQIEHQKHSE